MTTPAGDQITFTMNYRDAEKYSTWASRPAVPEVRAIIRQACRDYRPGIDDRVTIVITREQAETFVRKSTRPWRLPSGASVKSLIQLALDSETSTHDSVAAREAREDESIDPSDVVEQPLDVHSEEPDQEPSPVADEADDEDTDNDYDNIYADGAVPDSASDGDQPAEPQVDVRAATEIEHEAALPSPPNDTPGAITSANIADQAVTDAHLAPPLETREATTAPVTDDGEAPIH